MWYVFLDVLLTSVCLTSWLLHTRAERGFRSRKIQRKQIHCQKTCRLSKRTKVKISSNVEPKPGPEPEPEPESESEPVITVLYKWTAEPVFWFLNSLTFCQYCCLSYRILSESLRCEPCVDRRTFEQYLAGSTCTGWCRWCCWWRRWLSEARCSSSDTKSAWRDPPGSLPFREDNRRRKLLSLWTDFWPSGCSPSNCYGRCGRCDQPWRMFQQ